MDDFKPIIGIEIHVQLRTASKMFCGCLANWFGKEQNTLCCPVCLGLPGALPAPNCRAIEWCLMLGMALNCQIPELSKFDRKNYFYPDLPKGYQISQYDQPLAINGSLQINNPITQSSNNPIKQLSHKDTSDGGEATTSTPPRWRDQDAMVNKKIRIRRVHLEEDTGKLLHTTIKGEKCTLIDFNRSGVPLMEIVTEPDIRDSEEARTFLKKLQQIVRYLGISDADMEKGSMRLEPNVSVRKWVRPLVNPKFDPGLPVKNARRGGRLNPPAGGESHNSLGVEGLSKAVRHLPGGLVDSWQVEESELPPYKVEIKNINSFAFTKKAIDYEIKRQIELLREGKTPKQETRGWDERRGLTVSQRSKEEAHDYRYFPEPDIPPISWNNGTLDAIRARIPELPAEKLNRFMKDYGLLEYDAAILTETREVAHYYETAVKNATKEVTVKAIANWIINKRVNTSSITPQELVKLIHKRQQVVTVDIKQLEEIVRKVINDNPKAVADYKSGKQQAIMFLIGQVMKETKEQVKAQTIKQKILSAIS